MSDNYLHPPTDPEIALVVDQLRKSLEELPESVDSIRTALERGITPGELRGITPDEYAALYGMAHKLCTAGDFQNALVIGLQLVFHDPRNARYAFLTGSCLQRCGQPQQAAWLYALALELDAHHAVAAYRLGECLLAMDKPTDAKNLFEKTLDLSRGDFSRRELLLMAEKMLARISTLA